MLVYYFNNFMLIRLGEQEAATDLNTVIKYMHACQTVGNKFHRNSQVFHTGKLSVSPTVLSNSRHPFQGEEGVVPTLF